MGYLDAQDFGVLFWHLYSSISTYLIFNLYLCICLILILMIFNTYFIIVPTSPEFPYCLLRYGYNI